MQGQQQQRDTPVVVPCLALDLLFQLLLETGPVGDAGQLIGRGDLFQFCRLAFQQRHHLTQFKRMVAHQVGPFAVGDGHQFALRDDTEQIAAIVERLYRAFVEFDAMLCEINPLIVTPAGEVKALDSKFTVDDSALFRHPDVAEWRDTSAADPIEAFAREKGVTYVKLDGEVGILGNGAGLSMSTVDVVAHVGGHPANFCDLGGGGSAQGVVDALEGITRDTSMRLAREQLELEVSVRSIDRSELYVAEEVFFCGTGAQVAPCMRIDDRPVGDARIGPVARALSTLYTGVARGDDDRYPEWRTAVYPS